MSKQAIEKQGSLFSPRDFQKIASSRIVNFFGRPFDPPRKDVLRSLQAYQQKAPSISAEEKWSALDALEIKTQSYFSDKQTMLGRLPQGSSQRVNLGKDIQAAQLLFKGIALEKQKLVSELSQTALKKQKDLTEKSPCTILEEDTSEDGTASTASGEMATLNIVTYNVKGGESNEKSTGYFKPVGSELMNSTVGKGVGISEASTAVANLSGRAVATYRISQLLGLSSPSSSSEDLVPETHFACLGDKYGALQLSAEGKHLATEKIEEKTIPRDQVTRDQIVVDVACSDLKLESGEKLELHDHPFLAIDEQGRVCDTDLDPLSRKEILGLVQSKKITLDSAIISGVLESDLQRSIIETIKGETALTLKDLALKDSSLTIKRDQIFENDQPITLDRVTQLVGEKKIVSVKKVITPVNDIDFKNPCLQQEMSDAHVLDLLTGQIDRRAINFIYQQKESDWHIKLIDNDLSFPAKLDHVALSSLSEDAQKVLVRSPMPKLLPRLVSRPTAERILALTPEALEESLENTGLSKEEIESTKSRLTALKEHLNNLSSNIGGRLVDEWNDQTYDELMKREDNYIYQGQKSKALALESVQAAQLSNE